MSVPESHEVTELLVAWSDGDVALNHHNLVTIHDLGSLDGLHYIAMEYVEGQTLRELAAGRLKLKEILSVVSQAAEALAAAHRAGVVHRDVKPENIMVRADGYVKVLDFGLAKLLEASTDIGAAAETQAGAVMGTLAYRPPTSTHARRRLSASCAGSRAATVSSSGLSFHPTADSS